MPLKIVRHDITRMNVDAIVTSGNTSLRPGSGVCGTIFRAAGIERLQKECQAIGGCSVGHAVVTKGYDLPAKYIVHTVGPTWQGGHAHEAELLADCYTHSLTLAMKSACTSIAFPLISSGIFGYPKEEALEVAIAAIGRFLREFDMTVYLVVYDRESYVLSKKLHVDIQSYIDDHYIEDHPARISDIHTEVKAPVSQEIYYDRDISDEEAFDELLYKKKIGDLQSIIDQASETFSERVVRLMQEKRMQRTDVYRSANIDRRLFSKIYSRRDYTPGRQTALALAIGLELTLEETNDLLLRAGYALSCSSRSDLIVKYFIENRRYDIFELNSVLYGYDLPTLND